MATIPIRLPELGTGGEPARVSCWLVELGEEVDAGDRIIEVQIPGLTFDVAAPATGTLVRIEKSFNATVATGDVLGWIDSGSAVDGDA